MENREIVLNLWYVHDEHGIIYSLRAKAYVCEGSEEDKLSFLQQRALLDYLVAEPFEVPKPFHLKIIEGADSTIMPVGHISVLQKFDNPIALFEDAIKMLESRMPAQSEIEISQDPLICTTPLFQNELGIISPKFAGKMRFS